MSITISDTSPRVQYTASGSQTAFSVPFEFFNDADLVVIKTVSGTDTTLTLASSPANATQYSVTGAGATGGGNITLGGASTNGHIYTIYRELPISRTTDFPSSGTFPIETLNTELDKIIAMAQQLERDLKFSPRAVSSTSNTFNLTFPNLVANKILSVNSAGNALEFAETTTNVNTVAGIASDISTLAAISSDIQAVENIASNVTAVAGDATDIGVVAGKATEIGLLGTSDAISDMNTLGTSSNVTNMNTLSGISSSITTTASINGNINTVAGIASNVSAVAGDATDIGAVAGKATEIGRLGTSDAVADLAILGTSAIVTDMGLLATSSNITAMGHLGNSATVTALGVLGTTDAATDMALLGTAQVVEDMGLLATSAVIEDMGLLANSATIADMAILATSDIVNDLSILATTDFVSDLNQLATSDFVSDLNALEGIKADVETVADNVAGVNSFASRYRVASSDPSSNNDEGDLAYNTTSNALKYFNGSSFVAVTAPDVTLADATALAIALG